MNQAKIETLKAAVAKAEADFAAAMKSVKAAGRMDAVVNEGGEGYSTAEAASERAFNLHMPIIKAAKDALFVATWTAEVLAERRATWNANVVKCRSNKDMAALSARLGYGFSDITRAKTLHGIA